VKSALKTAVVSAAKTDALQSGTANALRTMSIGKYTYTITPGDLQLEQAFEAGEGVSI